MIAMKKTSNYSVTTATSLTFPLSYQITAYHPVTLGQWNGQRQDRRWDSMADSMADIQAKQLFPIWMGCNVS